MFMVRCFLLCFASSAKGNFYIFLFKSVISSGDSNRSASMASLGVLGVGPQIFSRQRFSDLSSNFIGFVAPTVYLWHRAFSTSVLRRCCLTFCYIFSTDF